MLMDIFDKAIASIEGNDWSFTNWGKGYRAMNVNANSLDGYHSTWTSWMGRS